jgi:quercetin dioxygenase-like cupin family protein
MRYTRHAARHTRAGIAAILALAVVVLPVAQAASPQGQLPPGPSTRFRSDFDAAGAPDQFALVQLVLDFEPGAFTPVHTHGGLAYVTVLEGDMTVREDGAERTYAAGETWVEIPGEFAAVGNPGASAASILVSFLVPPGAPLTSVRAAGASGQAPPGPTTRYRSDFAVGSVTTPFDVVHVGLDFAPGAFTPVHTHGGDAFVTVLAGQMAIREAGLAERLVSTGETWVEQPGEFAAVGNSGETDARIAVTFLLPKGAALTTVDSTAPAQEPPATDDPVEPADEAQP